MVTTRSGFHPNSLCSNTQKRSKGKSDIIGTVKISPKPTSSISSTSKPQTPKTEMVEIQDTLSDRISSPPQVELVESKAFTSNSESTPHFGGVSTQKSNIEPAPTANFHPNMAPRSALLGHVPMSLSDHPTISPSPTHPDGCIAGNSDEVVDRSSTIIDTITTSQIGDASVKQDFNLKAKEKSSETRKTVTFQEPDREVVRTKSRVPIGDAHANVRILHTAETMGKKLYTQYIRRRYPTTTPPHDVPPEFSATQLVGLVICQEPLAGELA